MSTRDSYGINSEERGKLEGRRQKTGMTGFQVQKQLPAGGGHKGKKIQCRRPEGKVPKSADFSDPKRRSLPTIPSKHCRRNQGRDKGEKYYPEGNHTGRSPENSVRPPSRTGKVKHEYLSRGGKSGEKRRNIIDVSGGGNKGQCHRPTRLPTRYQHMDEVRKNRGVDRETQVLHVF